MKFSEALAAYMATNGIATPGTNLYDGEAPFDKTDVISMVYVPSPEPNRSLDLFTQVIDFWSRYKTNQTGFNKMQAILTLFHKGQNFKIDGYHVYFSNAMGMIDDMDRDAERRKIYRLSVRFIYRIDQS